MVKSLRSIFREEIFEQANIRLCNNSTFNKLNLRCIYFNDWLIAFSIHKSSIPFAALLLPLASFCRLLPFAALLPYAALRETSFSKLNSIYLSF
jgi:hypothetical protein